MFVRRTNRFWSVSLKHTLFLDFLKLFRTCVSQQASLEKKTHFLDLRIKNYGCLKFQGEAWAGRACAAANEKELTTCAKSGGEEEKNFQQKWEQPNKSRHRPVAGGRPLVTGRPWTAGLPATSGRDLVSRLRPGPDRWSPAAWRPAVTARRSAAQGQLVTSGRLPAVGRRLDLLDCPNFLKFFSFKK
jgi:hypothetical protein